MSKDIEYMIAHSPSLSGLERTVENYIEEGWKPKGGIGVVPLPNDQVTQNQTHSFMQAMIRKRES
jgi:hypothetical protein